MRALAEKVVRICREIALLTEEPGRTTRGFLSPPMREVHALLGGWMGGIGVTASIDAAGNLRGVWGAPDKPRWLIGSHLDTVPNAGAFDGILGVVMAIALCETRPDAAVEVVGFSEEEGVRFGFPFIGSRALTGELDAAMMDRCDAAGVSVREAIRDFGLDPENLPAARLMRGARGYLEFHIEQGPVLENLRLPVAVVDTIAGQSRWTLTFQGRANHAGTTPMPLRRDALAAAAEWIAEVEQHASATAGLVATVGSLSVSPGAVNVIPGVVHASLDVRHACDDTRNAAVRRLLSRAEAICERRGVSLATEERLNQPAVAMNAELVARLSGAVQAAGIPLHKMTSGAGHDAMILAPHVPSAMLFLRSPGGISHHPDESVLINDVEAALRTGVEFLKHA